MTKQTIDIGTAADDGTGDPLRTVCAKVNDNTDQLFAGARAFAFKSRTTTAEPGAPADGDTYLIPASATGSNWTGQDGKIAIWSDASSDGAGAWLMRAAIKGDAAWVQDEDLRIRHDGSAFVLADYYDIPLSYSGGPPTSDEVMFALVAARDIYFAADFAGSYGYIGTNPTGSFVISVKDDGTAIGTITISTGGTLTFATTSNAAQTVVKGSRLEFVAPSSADATAAYILVTLAGYAK